MSLSSSSAKAEFPLYDGNNYSAWIEGVRDYLLVENLEAVFECSEVEKDEDGAEIEIAGTDNAKRALEKKIKLAWVYLRRHLNEEWKQRVVGANTGVDRGDPVKLLRYLRRKEFDNSRYDRNRLREDFASFTFDSCSDFEDFVSKFREFVSKYTQFQIGGMDLDEDKMHQFMTRLPDAYDYAKTQALAQDLNFEGTVRFFEKLAKSSPALPGSTHHEAKKRNDTVNSASETVCRQFRETGKCRFGNRCKYTHPPTRLPRLAIVVVAQPKRATSLKATVTSVVSKATRK